jgi:RNA polymerase sigma-70 factor (ECF subfamily)
LSAGPPHDRRDEFEEVALPHFDALFNLAFTLTRNRKDAEDLVQETYLRAYRFFDSYASGTHVRAWLFRILRNTFVNRYRSARLRPEEVDFARIDSDYERLVDDGLLWGKLALSPEELVMRGVLDAEVEEALAALPEEYRSVVLLALLEGLSYREIAAALSIPLGTVMSRLHRGRKVLQATLLVYARRKGILRPPSRVASGGDI